jgi:hypothetical protein
VLVQSAEPAPAQQPAAVSGGSLTPEARARIELNRVADLQRRRAAEASAASPTSPNGQLHAVSASNCSGMVFVHVCTF